LAQQVQQLAERHLQLVAEEELGEQVVLVHQEDRHRLKFCIEQNNND